MKIIKPSAEIMSAEFGVDVLKKIESVGRICYKSEDKTTDESAPKFVANLIKRGHEAMLEHASFCFELSPGMWNWTGETLLAMSTDLKQNGEEFLPRLRFTQEDRCLVSGNVRAWRGYFLECRHHIGDLPMIFKDFVETNPVLFPEFQGSRFFGSPGRELAKPIHREDLKTKAEVLIHCDVTAKFLVDRGVSHEIVRHRPASFAQESTRYCNYSKGKFGGEITVVKPCFWDARSDAYYLWYYGAMNAEAMYFDLIKEGAPPEQARDILPTSTKTEIAMTATCGEWRHFFNLRALGTTGKPHPQMAEVALPLLEDFKQEFSKESVFEDMKEE